MEPISMKGKTKRGNEYSRRYNKTADGMTRTNADRPRSAYSDDALSLMVKGTLDSLSSYCMKITSRIVHHPTDAGYTKRVRCLSKFGKSRLARLRRIRAARK